MDRVRRLPLKNTAFIGLVTLAVGVLIITLFIRLASASCFQEYRQDEQIKVNGQILKVQIAETSQELGKGLSGKSCIGDSQAMLFILGRAGDYSFWMKDMKFPVDIVWLNSKRQVIQIDTNVSPDSYPRTFTNRRPAQYALELKANRATEIGIKEGTLIDL